MSNLHGFILGEHAKDDILRMFCDDAVGEGGFRDVLSLKHLPRYVMKLERHAGCFHNAREWEVWQALRDTKHAKWLAPCLDISPCGIALIQERTYPIHPAFKMPEKVPAWMTDLKPSNWGLIEDKNEPSGYRLVCHDYGCNLLLDRGATGAMRKADWVV